MRLKAIVLAAALGVAALGLAACQPPSSVTDQQVSDTIAKVQATTQQVCGYLPAVQTVTGILSTFITSTAPVVDTLNAIANGICGAVTKKSLNRSAGPPVYRGVAIEGEFVRRK